MPANSGNATFSSIGELLPSPSSFGPGEYETVLEAEAKKKADYLSQMDQFYAQLDEMERQFDLDLGMRERLADIQADQVAGQQQLGWLNSLSNIGFGAAKMFQDQYNTDFGYDWAEDMYSMFNSSSSFGQTSGGISDLFDIGGPGIDLGQFAADSTDLNWLDDFSDIWNLI